jgi:hypothetical protein
MCQTAVNICLTARSPTNVVSRHACRAALLGALLLLAASLPAGSLAGTGGASSETNQPVPSVRGGTEPPATPYSAPGGGRHLVLQVRGSG